jgi:hypothetical protein
VRVGHALGMEGKSQTDKVVVARLAFGVRWMGGNRHGKSGSRLKCFARVCLGKLAVNDYRLRLVFRRGLVSLFASHPLACVEGAR